MERQRTAFRSSKAIAAAALAGFGAVACLGHLLGAYGSQAAGILPAAIAAVSQAFESYAANHQCPLQGFLQHILVFSWPLLVMAGTVLSPDTSTGQVNALPKDERGPVDLTARRSTFKRKSGDLKLR
jgi:hypothetical protein